MSQDISKIKTQPLQNNTRRERNKAEELKRKADLRKNQLKKGMKSSQLCKFYGHLANSQAWEAVHGRRIYERIIH